MPITQKPLSHLDYEQTMQSSYNDVNATLSVDGFLTGKVGRKVELSITTTVLANDTEVYNFSEGGIALYELTIIYTDSTRAQLVSAERTA
jgi:hypothetical protein